VRNFRVNLINNKPKNMKKYLLLLALASFINVRSQFVITSTANPVAGDVESYLDTYTTNLNQPASGTNQLWNYSSLTINYSNPVGSATYVPISSVPNNNLFPGGTLGAYFGGTSYDVYKLNSSTRDILGSAASTASDCMVYSNPVTLLTLPFTYGSGFTDYFSSSFNGTSITGTVSASGNGTGTLVLPGFTFPNTLKMTYTINQVYTYSLGTVTFSGTQDLFYSAASKFPLFTRSLFTSTQGTLVTTSLTGNINKLFAPVGLTETGNENELSVYPNPVNAKKVTVSLVNKGEAINVTLLNYLGQSIKETSFTDLQMGENKLEFDLKNIPSGVYFLKVKNGNFESVKKLIIE